MKLTMQDLQELLTYLNVDLTSNINLEKLRNNSRVLTIEIDNHTFLSTLLSLLNELGVDFNNSNTLDFIINFISIKKTKYLQNKADINDEIIKIVDCLLYDLKAPKKFLKYNCLKDAIITVVNILRAEPDRRIAMGKEVYSVLSTKYETTPSSIERNIRYSIMEIEDINYKKRTAIIDYLYGKNNHHYTNNQFIYKMAYYVLEIIKNDELSEEEIYVNGIIAALGINQSTSGYHYLKDSLLYAIKYYKEKPNVKIIVSKAIYPALARKYKTQPINIEHGIRNAITNISKVQNSSINKDNKFIQLFSSGINYTNGEFINTIVHHYFSLQKSNSDSQNSDLEKIIDQVLLKLGLPYNYLGQKYLKECVLLMTFSLERGFENKLNITKDIYPMVAKKYHTTTASVEYNIRTVISKIQNYNRGSSSELAHEFYLNGDIHYTNSEFISLLVQYLMAKKDKKSYNQETVQLDIIDKMLIDLGITPKCFGYGYLKVGILETIKFYRENSSKALYITKDIYPIIAKKYNVSIANVEYNIRSLINNISKVQNSISNKQSDISKALYGENNVYYSNEQFINALVQYFYEKQENNTLKQISPQTAIADNMLKELGIPRNYVGFHYLKDSLLRAINFYNTKPRKRLIVSKEVYPCVAEKHGVSPENIELSIRNIITKVQCSINKNKSDIIFHLYPTKNESYSNVDFLNKLISYYYKVTIYNAACWNCTESLNEVNEDLIDTIINSLLLDSTTVGFNLFRELIKKIIKNYDKGCNLNDMYLAMAQSHNVTPSVIFEEISKTIKESMGNCINIGFYNEATETIYSSWMHFNTNEVISNFVEFYYANIKKASKKKNQNLQLSNIN